MVDSESMQTNDIKGAVTSVLQRLFQSHQKRTEPSYTLSEVSVHCDRNDCWIVVRDHVYDVTSFLDKHPGGFEVLLEHAGRDATIAFFGAGHHPNTIDLLEPFCVGTLAQHERIHLISVQNRTLWPAELGKVTVAD